MASVIIIVRGKRNDGRLIIGQQLLPLLAHGFLRGVIDDRGRMREILFSCGTRYCFGCFLTWQRDIVRRNSSKLMRLERDKCLAGRGLARLGLINSLKKTFAAIIGGVLKEISFSGSQFQWNMLVKFLSVIMWRGTW
ncbi:hypothetical protein CEXT_329251 [Caerostris extrusa]|uniref:Uncharacterized protein n=1 Tax=Caerostris extrusa TaxID=172846 RepID=A0AAV4U7W4_CAEEX|nr:hypothetical protein CEXT_329251 [Caerostris extrusa]